MILYRALWIFLISRALIMHAPHRLLCIILTPVSQMITGIGGLLGLFKALIMSLNHLLCNPSLRKNKESQFKALIKHS